MQILIIDLGSQYTKLINRVLRKFGIRSIIIAPGQVKIWLQSNQPRGIILSGGYASVNELNTPQPPIEILNMDIPILGICYGMQWLVKKFGGKISAPLINKQYGETQATFDVNDTLFVGLSDNIHQHIVWASHGDSIDQMPENFLAITRSGLNRQIIGIRHKAKPVWGLMFHPEVTQTQDGSTILVNFLFGICHCLKDWSDQDIVMGIKKQAHQFIADQNGKAILAYSGGVDSSTIATIIGPILGQQKLRAICIDADNLRQNELEEIKKNAMIAGVQLKAIHAQKYFLKALQGTTDPQRKRRIFQALYGIILSSEARKFGASWLIQGTLSPDVIESGKVGGSSLIKTHHNTGLKTPLKQWNPLKEFFKYEVRDLARELGLPTSISERQPFPGPGLFIRIVGTPVTTEKLQIVRWADSQVTKILRRHDIYHEISQLVVALCGRSVGVKGDHRVYGWNIIVRPVVTIDFMTASGYHIPTEIKTEIENALTQHPKIVRVAFDTTSKPPATIEPE